MSLCPWVATLGGSSSSSSFSSTSSFAEVVAAPGYIGGVDCEGTGCGVRQMLHGPLPLTLAPRVGLQEPFGGVPPFKSREPWVTLSWIRIPELLQVSVYYLCRMGTIRISVSQGLREELNERTHVQQMAQGQPAANAQYTPSLSCLLPTYVARKPCTALTPVRLAGRAGG